MPEYHQFVEIEPLFASNDQTNGLRFPLAALRSPKSDRFLARTIHESP